MLQSEVTLEKEEFAFSFLVPVDGNICEGLEQVRRAAIEKSGS